MGSRTGDQNAGDALGNLEDAQAALRKAEKEICQKQWELDSQRRYQMDERVGIPWSQDVMSTLTDLYQVTMSYAYWKAGKHNQTAAFEVFFRRNPFGGEYTILAGVNDVMRFINTFKFDATQIRFLKSVMPNADNAFFEWLGTLDASKLTVYSVKEGNMVFPREPVMRIEGPLAVCQLMETTVLNLLNFASLIATNAARYRMAAGFDKILLEFGLRRAQGPDGGMSASRFSFLGGFDATSNVRASFLFGIPCKGTHAHAYISSFKSLEDLPDGSLAVSESSDSNGSQDPTHFKERVLEIRNHILANWHKRRGIITNDGELAAFIAYAQAFPNAFLCLVDTYDVLISGVPNFCFVAIALREWGYTPLGVRLDSGDLSYLSVKARSLINELGAYMGQDLSRTHIVASNSINEEILHSFNLQTHAIDTYGIGTHLVTCYNQPALGMVFKLCEIDNEPAMKISQELGKTTLPYKKAIYRLFDKADVPLLDLIDVDTAPPPQPGARVYCQHIIDESKRCYVIPSRVERLLKLHWKQGRATKYGAPTCRVRDTDTDSSTESESPPSPDLISRDGSECKYDGKRHFEYLKKCREICLGCLKSFRPDHLRAINPTPYKISISRSYSEAYRTLWDSTAPVRTFE
eukprot:Gregarina_sp_Poly_1__4735@NODE_252_length_10633_cov_239_890119_g220_i0_p4_GENE_NODE_252_length_10633_cov_239_890119_g220_i0NODE_252_length_10633_cov_239_890119_g220_i0_p4_ORF_typecomplete_len635_score81_01NAPRTase/PF04095_16/7_2e48NAPRTase_N/PF17767_1/1_2e41NAPRTase_N/PF17767_1/1_2e04NAPRTase_C/PF17956_1/3_6e22QRPTase_N/PF02749_16/0_00017PH_15/PF17339_2/0_12_NODE_252_length_10633_cov_239_890119_g220_i056837587